MRTILVPVIATLTTLLVVVIVILLVLLVMVILLVIVVSLLSRTEEFLVISEQCVRQIYHQLTCDDFGLERREVPGDVVRWYGGQWHVVVLEALKVLLDFSVDRVEEFGCKLVVIFDLVFVHGEVVLHVRDPSF